MTDPLLTPEGRQSRVDYWLHSWPEVITEVEAAQTADSEVMDAYLESISDLCHSVEPGNYANIVRMLSDIHATLTAKIP
jgi:hypothetical protein